MDIDALNIENLILNNNLGNKVIKITRLLGGATHVMYKVETDNKVYAVKKLNPEIMERKDAYFNFVFTEQVSEIAMKNGILAVNSIKINNDIMTKIGNYFYMVFDFIEGMIITAEETTKEHCKRIAIEVAKIHNIDFSIIEDEKRKEFNLKEIDFDKYITLAKKENKKYLELLIQNKELLIDIKSKIKKYLDTSNLVISHTDIHRKNVIWKDDIPYLIDWEASNYINPILEIYQVAWYWSNEKDKSINYDKFKLMLETYKQNVNKEVIFNVDELIYQDMYGRINWLYYNLERSLCISEKFDQEVLDLSDKEIIDSINEINLILSRRNELDRVFERVNVRR